MIDKLTRNLQLIRSALDKDQIHYFSSSLRLIAYMPCIPKLKHRTLYPSSIKVTIKPSETGILFEVSLPVALRASCEADQQAILLQIAKENYGNIRGGLVYQSEAEQLLYRIFCVIGEDASGFAAEEVAACVKIAASALSDGYEAIINALDNASEEDALDDASGKSDEKLTALVHELLAHQASHDPLSLLDLDADGEDAEDGSASDSSILRSLLEDLLNDDANE